MSVTIVMPCYNEENCIAAVIQDYYGSVIAQIPGSELLVVDDCSTDTTPAILSSLQQSMPALRILRAASNRGHGGAVRYGYENAANEWIFQVDSDGQFNSDDFWGLYQHRKTNTFIVGYRHHRNDPLYRLLLSRSIRMFIAFVFGIWLKDPNCPYRLMRRDVLLRLLTSIPTDALAPNIMLSILAKRDTGTLYEIPIQHYPRASGRSKLVNVKLLGFAFKGMLQLIRFRWQLIRTGNDW